MFVIRHQFREEATEGAAAGGGGDGAADGVMAAAAAAAASGDGDQITADQAREFLTPFVHDPQQLNSLDEKALLEYHGRVRTAHEERVQAAIADAQKKANEGKGEKPDWLPEQFWDAEKGETKLEAMVKSWSDTRGELKKAKGATGKVPAKADEYTYERPGDLPAHINTDPDSEDVKVLREAALKAGLTQDQFVAFANEYFTSAASLVPAPVDVKAEMEKLGENAEAVVQACVGWTEGLVNAGVLSKDEQAEIMATGSTAAGLRALNKLREQSGGQPIPTGGAKIEGLPSEQELYAMVNSEKYQTDPAERARVDALFAKVYGTAPAGSSKSGLGVQ